MNELQFMHLQSDMKKQTQNETHAHSAFSYLRAITRDRGLKNLSTERAWGPFLESPGNFTGPK